MKTYDGIEVRPEDKVWVIGSFGIHQTTVLPPATSYVIFGNNVEVKHSFSTKEAAEKHLKTPRQ